MLWKQKWVWTDFTDVGQLKNMNVVFYNANKNTF